MCGFIAGFALPGAAFAIEPLVRGREVMRARGPDAEGLWSAEDVILAHRRLAIIDLDARAHQPMLSRCGRYVIVFNGEIYNFSELRTQLARDGAEFHTSSDTEVLLEMFKADGERMLRKLRGMFTFVIWDRQERRALLARDPYGIKPLYYAHTPLGLLISSQVKAILETGYVSRAESALGQAGFWLTGSVPEPYTWYEGVKAVPAGHFAWIADGRLGAFHRWWDIARAWRSAAVSQASDGEVRSIVREALLRSVAAHMVADVPIGVFLSGGIDSGAVAGLMVECGANNLIGVTLAFEEYAGSAADEAPIASRVALQLGIKHYVRTVTRHEFASDLPRIIDAMDQPSVDGINTWYASKAVAELGLKVVMSGVGGDELFQGYASFRRLPRLVNTWRRLSAVPGVMPLAQLATAVKAQLSGDTRWRYLPQLARSLSAAWRLNRSVFSPADVCSLMGADAVSEDSLNETFFANGGVVDALASDDTLAIGQLESTAYLRNQLLRDSDWASMAHSVELRTPLVDAWLLRDVEPILSTFRRFRNKGLLSGALTRVLPADVLQRKKTGFGIPVAQWGSKDDTYTATRHPWPRRIASYYRGEASK